MILRELQIKAAFNSIKKEYREDQGYVIDNILKEYLDNHKRNVILCADTGVGKSIIAAVVAKVIQEETQSVQNAVFTSSTNALVNQYADTFNAEPDSVYHRVKGASNYPCNYFIQKGNKTATGEDCVERDLTESECQKYCKGCSYKKAKGLVNYTENLITNYSYFMIGKMWTKSIKDRTFHVFDEAHLLNDVFCDSFGMVYNVESLNRQITELTGLHSKFTEYSNELILFRDAIIDKKMDEDNYRMFLEVVFKTYSKISKTATSHAAMIPDLKDKKKFTKLSSRYSNQCLRISDFFKYKYEHSFDNSVDKEVSIKPIFISKMIEPMLGQYNLFMSATLSKQFAETTFDLDEEQTAFIDAMPVFPSENRPVLFLGKDILNYQKLQDNTTFDELGETINAVIQFHSNEKGIILAPSFYNVSKIADRINVAGVTVFQHKSGSKIVDVMEAFKKYEGPSVLISPSIFEGLDFEGDHSRYQIIFKTPFPSLGDKRIKKISTDYPSIYREIALYKILQGIGRSIRSKTDSATTYFLDKSSADLFGSRLNLWKNRYKVVKG